MTGIIEKYTESKEAERGFWPTPQILVEKMLAAVDWKRVDSMLEPSAGKGDIALPAIKKWQQTHGIYTKYDQSQHPGDMDCIEIDPNLRAILKDKGLRVVHDDFMTYYTMRRYSLIITNPDFKTAASHLMKAISLLKPEGQLVALCNAETIKNPCTNERSLLLRTLGDARIEYLTGAFHEAERKTDVEVALIVYKAPVKAEKSFILENLRQAHKYVGMTPEEASALTKADFVEAIIDRYNYEVESGIRLIQEYRAISSMVCETEGNAADSMTLCVNGNNRANEEEWIRAVRRKYWRTLFASPQFVKQLTSNLRMNLYNRVQELEDYEFSYYNIKEIMIQMTAHVTDGIESTIMELFDKWTRKYHWDENAQNRHYFDGWRTNDAFAVNRKVILPLNGYTHWTRCADEFRAYNVREKLEDIEKVFNYLDGGRTPDISLAEILLGIEKTGQTRKVESKYFFLTFYKKGTCHIEFKNEELLAKFNIFAARGKNWLPPSFGRKRYTDLSAEEKKTVDSFMDDKTGNKYEAVCANADYYLSAETGMLNLTA